MKLGQENIKIEIFFFKNQAENEARILVPDLLFFFKRDLGKIKCSAVLFQYFLIALGLYNKTRLHETLVHSPRDILNFDFFKKDLGIVSPPHFAYDFSRKMFLILYSIKWPNFIVWFPLLLTILGDMCIAIVSFPGCGVINFVINLIF